MPPETPTLADGLPEGWERIEERTQELFSAGPVTVVAATAVYEDAALAAEVAEHSGVEGVWRFVFTSRLTVRPAPGSVSRALEKLVVSRAKAGFADELRARGFSDVEAVGRRSMAVGDADATLVEYDATCTVGTVDLSVRGWLAVWPDGDSFLLGGGAYPTAVVAGSGDAADAIRECLRPDDYRPELFDLIRGLE